MSKSKEGSTAFALEHSVKLLLLAVTIFLGGLTVGLDVVSRGDFLVGKREICSTAAASVQEVRKRAPDVGWRQINVSLQDAYFSMRRSVPVKDLDPLPAHQRLNFTTRFLPNRNAFDSYPLYAVENMCLEPTPESPKPQFRWVVIGTAVPVGSSQREQEFERLWKFTYNISQENRARSVPDSVVGVREAQGLAEEGKVVWVSGNTLHYFPYGGNSMHNWAERTWIHMTRFSPPFNQTTPHPVHHFLIQGFHHYMNHPQDMTGQQFLWQARMLMELAPDADNLLLQSLQGMTCFERLLLQSYDLDRMDYTRLPPEVSVPAARRYREAVFNFFAIPIPQVRLPPDRLKVVFYARRDVHRRRISNGEQVLAYLRNMTRPKLDVYSLDDMLVQGVTSYGFLDILSLHSQTDIWIVAHGANTWASFLMPTGAAIIELFGPCNWSPSSPNRFFRYVEDGTGQKQVHTWTHLNSLAAQLKHDISNPWKTAIAPSNSNSTQCINPRTGTPDYTVDVDKLGKIIQQLGWPSWPADRMTQHWLYDWSNSTA